MEWVIQAVLWLAILCYSGYLIRRRIRKIKNGQFCDCCEGGCAGCTASRGCAARPEASRPLKSGADVPGGRKRRHMRREREYSKTENRKILSADKKRKL